MQVLGIVPARGGSKGIPRKNLVPVGGQPLLYWTAQAARGSKQLTRTILSTDDEELARVGASFGLEVVALRPAALAADDTPILPVLQHHLAELQRAGYSAEAIVLLQPTSPLRRSEHIDDAVDLLATSGADSVVSVIEVPHQFNPVSVLCEERGELRPYHGTATITRRQDKPRVLARNGPAVLAVRREVVMQGSLYGRHSRPLLMTVEDSVDVDTPFDRDIADWLLRRRGTPA